MEATTVRLIKDGSRRILIFENVDESSDMKIADMVKNFMFPAVTEKAPYMDKPTDTTMEIAKEVTALVNEATSATPNSLMKNMDLIEMSQDVKTKLANVKASFKVVTSASEKPVLSLSLTINQVKEIFDALKNGENPLSASGLDYTEACYSIYALISRFLTNEKYIDTPEFIQLYEMFGYEGSLDECRELAKQNVFKKKIMPLQIMATMNTEEKNEA